MKYSRLFFLMFAFCLSCADDPQPKPKAFLALEYPVAVYDTVDIDCPYRFEKNTLARVVRTNNANECWLNLEYPLLDGTIFITYQPVRNNLDSLLRDAQRLPLQHTIKADVIEGDTYMNPLEKTYGMFYEVTGDAASQAQFYLTDSVRHFMTGAVYFRAQPNYDSILPAAAYLKNDIRHLMETIEWRENP